MLGSSQLHGLLGPWKVLFVAGSLWQNCSETIYRTTHTLLVPLLWELAWTLFGNQALQLPTRKQLQPNCDTRNTQVSAQKAPVATGNVDLWKTTESSFLNI